MNPSKGTDLRADKKMGIASSTESNFGSSTKSDPRYDLFILKKLDRLGEVKRHDKPEKAKVALEALAEATHDMYWKELYALFPPKLGESSTERPKEVDTERDKDDQVVEQFSDFMKGGGCKDSFKALEDCVVNTQSVTECKKHFPILKKCMDAHIGYYEPILALAKATEDKLLKGGGAIFKEHQQELMAHRNQPERR